jgi:hypothetical protein
MTDWPNNGQSAIVYRHGRWQLSHLKKGTPLCLPNFLVNCKSLLDRWILFLDLLSEFENDDSGIAVKLVSISVGHIYHHRRSQHFYNIQINRTGLGKINGKTVYNRYIHLLFSVAYLCGTTIFKWPVLCRSHLRKAGVGLSVQFSSLGILKAFLKKITNFSG